jgi:glutathione reductase (NADPH)
MTDFDLFVIGGGSGGVRAARIAAGHGAKVAIAEASRWGGTCVVRGCIPKKLMVYASHVRDEIEDARGFGWTIDGARHDWAAMIGAIDAEVARLSSIYAANLARAGAEVIEGRARMIDAHTIAVGSRAITAANIVIATGGHPRALAVPGGELAMSSDDVFRLASRPERLVVLGGGYIGVEMAHIFAGLGSQVAIAHRSTCVLRGFDGDLCGFVARGLARAGVSVRGGAEAVSLARVAGGIEVRFDHGDSIECDAVLAAIGRAPSTAGLGLDAAGVALDARGAIAVDEYSRSSVPHIYAVGDVSGRVALTPVAIREGHAVADTLFGGRPTPVRHDLVPTAVFAQPPAASIGLSEAAARTLGEIEVWKTDFRPLKHTITGRDERVLVKLVCDRASGRVLGLHVVGPDAPEIVQAAAIAVTMGCTKADLDRTFAVHPTTAEELVLLR